MFVCIRNRDEDEGIPSENEEEKKMLDTKARELKGKVAGGGLSPSSLLLLGSGAVPGHLESGRWIAFNERETKPEATRDPAQNSSCENVSGPRSEQCRFPGLSVGVLGPSRCLCSVTEESGECTVTSKGKTRGRERCLRKRIFQFICFHQLPWLPCHK